MSFKNRKSGITVAYIFLVVFELVYDIYNIVDRAFITDVEFLEIVRSLLLKVLFVLPLVPFIAFSIIAEKTEEKKILKTIRTRVIIYLSVDFVSGIIFFFLSEFFNISISPFVTFIFYSSSWLRGVVLIIKYHIYVFLIILGANIAFWIISLLFIRRLNQKISGKLPVKTDENEGISNGFIISIVSSIMLILLTAVNISISATVQNNMGTGEYAIGAAVVAFLLEFARILFSFLILPVPILSIIGVNLSSSEKEKKQKRKYHVLGLYVNIACLSISVLELLITILIDFNLY